MKKSIIALPLDFTASVKGDKTGKMKIAESYIAKGLDISIISEDTFFRMMDEE